VGPEEWTTKISDSREILHERRNKTRTEGGRGEHGPQEGSDQLLLQANTTGLKRDVVAFTLLLLARFPHKLSQKKYNMDPDTPNPRDLRLF